MARKRAAGTAPSPSGELGPLELMPTDPLADPLEVMQADPLADPLEENDQKSTIESIPLVTTIEAAELIPLPMAIDDPAGEKAAEAPLSAGIDEIPDAIDEAPLTPPSRREAPDDDDPVLASAGLVSLAAPAAGMAPGGPGRVELVRHDLVDAALPAGMVRITDGRTERFIWPVHLSGWEEQGWRLCPGGAALVPGAATAAAGSADALAAGALAADALAADPLVPLLVDGPSTDDKRL